MAKKVKIFWSMGQFLGELEPKVNNFLDTLAPNSIQDVQLKVDGLTAYVMVVYTEVKKSL